MKRLALAFFLLFAAPGCSGDAETQPRGESAADVPKAAKPPRAAQPLAPAMREEADRVLQFTNRATGLLTEGYYRLPDVLQDGVNHYLKTWRLPKLPQISGAGKASKALQPPEGIFTAQEERDLTRGLRDMDKALAAMLSHYRELEKYVVDPEVRDDGREARRLAKKIGAGRLEFMKARNGWLAMLEARAAEAQKILLQEHPLQRQILAAEKIFSLFREIGAQLTLEEPDAAILQSFAANLKELEAEAAKPPFPAAPALEREYRAFLKQTRIYIQTLDAGIREGFFAPQKRELNEALVGCRNAYNLFVREANAAFRN